MDVQVKLAPIVDKLPGVEEIMLEEQQLRALKSHLNSYRKAEFLGLAANILQKFIRKYSSNRIFKANYSFQSGKYPQEAVQSGIVQAITKLFFTAYSENSIEIAFNIMTRTSMSAITL